MLGIFCAIFESCPFHLSGAPELWILLHGCYLVCAQKRYGAEPLSSEKKLGVSKLTSTYKTYSTVRMDMDLMDPPGFLEKLSPVSRGDSLENPPTRNGRFCHVYGWYKPSKYISNGRFTARQIINDGLENFATIAALLFPPHFNDTTR